jgi:hypothetical protein
MITSSYSTEIKNTINNDISYIAFVFDNRIPKSTDNISTYHEFTRIVPTKTVNSDNILLECVIPITANTLNTTVTNKISNKQYTLASVTGLQVGDSIIFNYKEKTKIKDKITNISGNTITIEKGSSDISNNASVTQELTFIHIIKGGTSSPNTGNTICILPFNKIKYYATVVSFNIRIKT